jgi:hypothetical protein
MAARGVILTYEAVRYWCRKFGQAYANRLRRRHPRPGDKWHLTSSIWDTNSASALGGMHHVLISHDRIAFF